MIDLIREHQLNFMLFLAGVCFAVTLCGIFSRGDKTKKIAMFTMGISATLLMIFDRLAYVYRGNPSVSGFYMVRICNFITFLCPLLITFSLNWYIIAYFKSNFKEFNIPFRLKLNELLVTTGIILLIISQFTLYADVRQRRPGFSYAARPEIAIPLYEKFKAECASRGFRVACGEFGADMKVASVNDGPVTLLFDTAEL